MFITILIIFIFVLSIFYWTLFYNELVDAESERQALIASIEELSAINAPSDTSSTTPTKSSELWLTRSRDKKVTTDEESKKE